MLVITRKPGESVMIGDDVCIVVGKVSPVRVKLQVTAPRRVTVLRGELAIPAGQEPPVRAQSRLSKARNSLTLIGMWRSSAGDEIASSSPE